jgi:hypothetical protein
VLASFIVLAAAQPPLASGIDLYERGLYEKSRGALAHVLDLDLPDDQKNRARLYLAADYFALGDRRGALYALEDLARKAPAQHVDASVFPPDFLQLWTLARAHVAAERPPAERPPAEHTPAEHTPVPAPAAAAEPRDASLQPPVVAAPTPTTRRPFGLIALAPAVVAIGFGVLGWYSWDKAQSLHTQLTDPKLSPPTLEVGLALAKEGRDWNDRVLIGATGFAIGAVVAIALALVLTLLAPPA